MSSPSQNTGGEREKFAAAFGGLREALKTEAHFRFECVFAVVALLLCALLRVSAVGWVVVLVFCALVLAAELVNTAIESVVNLASPDKHPLARRAKDTAAAAVLVLSIAALICGIVIYAQALGRLTGWW